MGFWSDTGKFLSATGGALSEGMELLAQATGELEKAARRLRLETHIKLLEHQRARMGEGWFEASNDEQHQDLLDTYAELLRDFPTDSTASARTQLDQLHVACRSLAVNKQVQVITELNDRVKSANYSLAIDAINARKRQMGMLEELGRLGSKDVEHDGLVERSRTRIAELKNEIKDLEPQRRSIEITKYPSGANKTRVERFDGKLSGVYERWYQNGERLWKIPFSAGDIVGNVEHWREDGSRLLEAGFAREMQIVRAFSAKSQLLVEGRVQRPDIKVTLCSEELEGISLSGKLGSMPSKFGIAVKALFAQRLVAFVWKARKPGIQADKVQELTTLAEQVEQAIDDLLAIRKAG